MKARNFAGISISPITFGSMRLDPNRTDKHQALELLNYLIDHGVNTFHSSYEYATFNYFCDVFKLFKHHHLGKSLVHIVKLPAPHFKENGFCKLQFEKNIDRYLQDLNIECVDIVQWMLRHEPNVDEIRLPMLATCEAELNDVCELLISKGKMRAMASFPYSHAFAEKVIHVDLCSGLIDYLNLAEIERVTLFKQLQDQGKQYIAIRPLLGGSILNNCSDLLQKYQLMNTHQLIEFSIQFALLHPIVSSTIMSFSSIPQAKTAIEIASQTLPNSQSFMNIINQIQSVPHH